MAFLEGLEQAEKLEEAFNTLVAVRQCLSIAKRSPQPATYYQSLQLIHDIAPEYATRISQVITQRNEPDQLSYYRELVEGLNESGESRREVIDLVRRDLNELETAAANSVRRKKITSRINQLKAVIEYLEPRPIEENTAILRDYALPNRVGFFRGQIYDGEHFKDYSMPNSRSLRVRLFHPEHAERQLGVDLVYEMYDLANERVRFVNLQYKNWDEQRRLYFSSGNLLAQLQRMQENYCAQGSCNGAENDHFRLEHCSCFFRPTDKLQSGDVNLATNGTHIPVCRALALHQRENRSINADNIEPYFISNRIFEEMFILNKIGSEWINLSELENFYESHEIRASVSNLRVHAQEVISYREDVEITN